MTALLFFLLVWGVPYVPVQVPELSPEARLREVVSCVVRGKDGEAVTHLILLSERHPLHPAAPWARLGAAFLYERQGDYIAARVWYAKAAPHFAPSMAERLLQHARRLELETRRLPPQAMRLGRRLLSGGGAPDSSLRAFLVQFLPSPLHAEIRWLLASRSLQAGRRFEALFFLMWSAFDGHPEAPARLVPVLRSWPAPLLGPTADTVLRVLLALWLAALAIRLWQSGPAGPKAAVFIAALTGVLWIAVPQEAAFWPSWFFWMTLRLWVVGLPPPGAWRAEWLRWAVFFVFSLTACLHFSGLLAW